MEIVSVQDTDRLDMIFLLIIGKIINILETNFSDFESFLISELDNYIQINKIDEKKADIIRSNYKDELKEINFIVSTELYKILQSDVIKNLNNALNFSNIDLSLENYFAVYNMTNLSLNFNLENYFNFSNIFKKIQTEVVVNYFNSKEKKMRESVECEDWTMVNNVPPNFQKMLNYIIEINISEVKKKKIEEILKIFEENGNFTESEKEKLNENDGNCIIVVDGEISINNQNPNLNPPNTLNIGNMSYKLILSTLEILKVTFDSTKLMTIFDNSLINIISTHLSKYLNTFISLVEEAIIEGKAKEQGRIKKLSQNEAALANATASIIKNIISNLIKNNSNLIGGSNFSELITNIDNIRYTCKNNISDMIKDMIKGSIESLSDLNFSKYPVFCEDVNKFVKIYQLFNPVYFAMVNAFEDAEIVNTMKENLKIFFEKLEITVKNLNSSCKMSDPAQTKQ